MRSMKFPLLPSLDARRKNDGFGHRTTWAMWSVAVLLAVLVAAFPMDQTVSADDPTVEVEVVESSIDYETATVAIEATGVIFDDWILDVDYVNLGDHPYSRYKDAGPGLTQQPQGTYTFDYNFDADADTISVTFALDYLVPASDYEVTVILKSPSSDDIYDSATFSTKSGCYQEQPGTTYEVKEVHSTVWDNEIDFVPPNPANLRKHEPKSLHHAKSSCRT